MNLVNLIRPQNEKNASPLMRHVEIYAKVIDNQQIVFSFPDRI